MTAFTNTTPKIDWRKLDIKESDSFQDIIRKIEEFKNGNK